MAKNNLYKNRSVHTVLVVMSVDLAGTSASNDTVRRIHDDKVAPSNNCVLPIEQENVQIAHELNVLFFDRCHI